jgi:hypothetical protein
MVSKAYKDKYLAILSLDYDFYDKNMYENYLKVAKSFRNRSDARI